MIVVSMFPFETGALVPCRIVGMLEAESNLGPNAQVICIPLNEPRMRHINDINDIPEHLKNEMYNYYANYKALEDKDSWNIVKSWHCKEDAEIVVRRAYDTFFMMGVRMEELEKRLEAESKAKITLEERLNSIERRLEQLSGN